MLAAGVLGSSCSHISGGTAQSDGGVEGVAATAQEEALRSVLTCQQLAEAVRDELHGLTAIAERKGYLFELRYLPQAMDACRRQGGGTVADGVRAAGEALNTTDQYLLRIERTVAADTTVLDLDALLASGLERCVFAMVGGTEVSCAFAHIEAGPSNAPAVSVLIGFDHPQDAAERVVWIADPEKAFGGDLEFEFPAGTFARYSQLIRNRS